MTAVNEALGPYELLSRRVPGNFRICKGLNAGERFAASVHTYDEREWAATVIRKQAMRLRLLNHPHLLRLVDAVSQRHALGIVWSPLPTLHLLKRVHQCPGHKPSVGEARFLFRQVAFAIAYAHARGLANGALDHRSFLLSSPDHALVHRVGTHSLPAQDVTAPHGPASLLSDVSEPWESHYDFTPPEGFTAPIQPELDTSAMATARAQTDVWSLGMLLFAMVRGHNYSPQYEELDCSLAFTEEDDVRHLLSRMLDKNAANRISAGELLKHPWVTAMDSETKRRVQHDLLESGEEVDVPDYLLKHDEEPIDATLEQTPPTPAILTSPMSPTRMTNAKHEATRALRPQEFELNFPGSESDLLAAIETKTGAHIFQNSQAKSDYEVMCMTDTGLLHFLVRFACLDFNATLTESIASVKVITRAAFTVLRGRDAELAGVLEATRRTVGAVGSTATTGSGASAVGDNVSNAGGVLPAIGSRFLPPIDV